MSLLLPPCGCNTNLCSNLLGFRPFSLNPCCLEAIRPTQTASLGTFCWPRGSEETSRKRLAGKKWIANWNRLGSRGETTLVQKFGKVRLHSLGKYPFFSPFALGYCEELTLPMSSEEVTFWFCLPPPTPKKGLEFIFYFGKAIKTAVKFSQEVSWKAIKCTKDKSCISRKGWDFSATVNPFEE